MKALVVVSLIALGVVGLTALAFALGWTPAGVAQRLQPSCTVSVAGTDAFVTVQGDNARAECDSLVRAGPSTYLADNPHGTLMCRYPISGLTYTVYDSGTFKVTGGAVCDDLKGRYGPSPSP